MTFCRFAAASFAAALFLAFPPALANPADAGPPTAEPAKPDPGLGAVTTSPKACPRWSAPVQVLAVGSSTMVGALGPRLARAFKGDEAVALRVWGKSATGLARPDFFDWPKKLEELGERDAPNVWVAMLGTNDFQGIRMPDKRWIRYNQPGWADEYRRRVRRTLEIMAGPDRSRAVIYVGPTAFASKKRLSDAIGPVISQVIREEVERFDGPAVFYDAFGATSEADKRPRRHFTHPDTGKRVKLHGPDGIHLSKDGLDVLVQRPVMDLIRQCSHGAWVVGRRAAD